MGSRNVTCVQMIQKMMFIFKKKSPWAQISKDLDSEVYAGNTEDLIHMKWNEFENFYLLKYDIMRFDQDSLRNRIIGLPPDQIKVKPNFEHIVLHFAWREIFCLNSGEEIKLWKMYVFLFVNNDFSKYNNGIPTARSLDFADLFFDKVLKLICKEKNLNLAANNKFHYPISKYKEKLMKNQQKEEYNHKFELGDSDVRLNGDARLNLNLVGPAINESYDELIVEEYKSMEVLFKDHHPKVKKVTVKFFKLFLKAMLESVFEVICSSFVETINKFKNGSLRVNDIYWNNTLKEYIGSYYVKIPSESEKIKASKLDKLIDQDFDNFFRVRRNLERQVISPLETDPNIEKPFYNNETEIFDHDKVWLTFDDISSFFHNFSYYTDPTKYYEKYSKMT